jgi:ATP-dependent Clp protease ATP-binding subunit ClpA
MKIDKFTVKAQEALQEAQAVARRRDQQEILPEHILASLLAEKDGFVVPLLQRIGADPKLVQGRLDDELKKVPQVHGGEGGHLAQRTLKVLDAAEDEAKKLKDEYVSTEHNLLALAGEKRGAAAEVLKSAAPPTSGSRRRSRPSAARARRQPGSRGAVPDAGEVRIDLTERARKASSTRSSAATRRSAASSRCFPEGPRTIRSSSATPA